MNFALFRCCTTPVTLAQYESSTNAVLQGLGVTIAREPGFNCCGYPLKNFSYMSYVRSSARNLALAEKYALDVLTVCNCCFGSLKYAQHVLLENPSLRAEVNRTLAKEGLRYSGGAKTQHLLQALYHTLGMELIAAKLVKRYQGLKIATHYGCHILRPQDVVEFDNPFTPRIFDQLVEVTGAASIPWAAKLECCGSPQFGINDTLSTDLTRKKLDSARRAGADYLCVACPYCQLQFDRVQKMMLARGKVELALPSILYPQLLGLCLGIDAETLGLDQNALPASDIARFLVPNT
jgi:heterodisulfide reductase subunit B2